MSSGTPSFIRYFAQTDDGPLGKLALEYLRSMLRVAPVRLVSISGGLSGAWHRFENLLMTPMAGDYVNAVCVYPEKWVWTTSVPMTDRPSFPGGDDVLEGHEHPLVVPFEADHPDMPAAPRPVVDGPPGDRHMAIELPDPQPVVEIAERIDELYTPKVRNVLFMGVPPATEQQRAAAVKYQDIIVPTLLIANTVAARWPERSFDAGIVPVPVTAHGRIREAIVGRQ
jgi:hypothetical protein